MNWNLVIEVSEWISTRVVEIFWGVLIGVALALVYVAGEIGLVRF